MCNGPPTSTGAGAQDRDGQGRPKVNDKSVVDLRFCHRHRAKKWCAKTLITRKYIYMYSPLGMDSFIKQGILPRYRYPPFTRAAAVLGWPRRPGPGRDSITRGDGRSSAWPRRLGAGAGGRLRSPGQRRSLGWPRRPGRPGPGAAVDHQGGRGPQLATSTRAAGAGGRLRSPGRPR